MHADPFAYADADRCEFAIARPHTGEALAPLRIHTKGLTSKDERFLKRTQMRVKIPAARVEIEHRIPHQLTRTVIGRLTSAIGFKHAARKVFRIAQRTAILQSADRVNRFMLEQKNRIAGISSQQRIDSRLLQTQAILVGNGIGQMDDFEHRWAGD